jgi:hypothetical protein
VVSRWKKKSRKSSRKKGGHEKLMWESERGKKEKKKRPEGKGEGRDIAKNKRVRAQSCVSWRLLM